MTTLIRFLRRLVRPLPIIAIGALLTLALLEGGTRVLAGALGITPYMLYHEVYGWTARPNAVKRHRDRAGQFDVVYSINERGLRGPVYPLTRTPGNYRIVVLGDSTGFGWGVAENETFWSILDRELADTEVINLALSGYGIDQSYLRYQAEGAAYDADLIVLQVSHNDFEEIMHPFFNQKPKPQFLPTDDGTLRLVNVPPRPVGDRAHAYLSSSLPVPFKDWLGWNSYAYNLLNEFYFAIRRRSATAMTAHESIFNPASVLRFNEIARLIANSASERGAQSVMVLSDKQVSDGAYISPGSMYVIDLSEDFSGSACSATGSCYFADGYHWNAVGNRVAADKLKQHILKLRHGM